jgi:hypothetical protein
VHKRIAARRDEMHSGECRVEAAAAKFHEGAMSKFISTVSFVVTSLALTGAASAETIVCSGPADKVAAIADPIPVRISTKWQDSGAMQQILSGTISSGGPTISPSCIVAHFSAMARIPDNYVAFRVTIDGRPMHGHVRGLAHINEPAVWTSIDAADEQSTDPIKNISHNFYAYVLPGDHRIEVWAAAGSGLATLPTVYNPVVTLEYR